MILIDALPLRVFIIVQLIWFLLCWIWLTLPCCRRPRRLRRWWWWKVGEISNLCDCCCRRRHWSPGNNWSSIRNANGNELDISVCLDDNCGHNDCSSTIMMMIENPSLIGSFLSCLLISSWNVKCISAKRALLADQNHVLHHDPVQVEHSSRSEVFQDLLAVALFQLLVVADAKCWSVISKNTKSSLIKTEFPSLKPTA
jgi:hypothetical protein